MKKNSAILASVLMIVLVTGCGSDDKAEKKTSTTTEAVTEAATESTSEEPVGGTQLANPWRDITEEEAAITCPRLFAAPEGAQNVKWSVMESGETTTPMVQLVFTQNSVDYTARAQVGTEEADISGNYYQWTETDDITLANWGNGNQKAKSYSFVENDAARVMMVTWFDPTVSVNYSLSTVGDDLGGLDIRSVAEQIYKDRDKSAGSIKFVDSEEQK